MYYKDYLREWRSFTPSDPISPLLPTYYIYVLPYIWSNYVELSYT